MATTVFYMPEVREGILSRENFRGHESRIFSHRKMDIPNISSAVN
jgi:hypothetical protein